MFKKFFSPIAVIVCIVLVLTALLLALPSVALADEGGPPGGGTGVGSGDGGDIEVPTDPASAIKYLAAIPIAVFASTLMDWTIMRKWMTGWSATGRFWFVFGLFHAVPVVLTFISHLYSGIPDEGMVWPAYRDALFSGSFAWIAAIITHPATKAKPKAVG